MATYIDNTINESLGLEETVVSGQTVSAPDDILRKYGIIQEIMQQSEDTDVLLEAKRKIQENCTPEETLEFQCIR